MAKAMQDRVQMAQEFNLSMDFIDITLGEYIGEGTRRIVFDSVILPGYVVKVQKTTETFDNILEYEFWCSVMHQPEVSKWLAPCSWMSSGGRIMYQKKVKPIDAKNKKDIPDKVPAFLTDLKHSNFGFIGKQFVCIDYAFSASMCSSEAMKGRMIKFKSHLQDEQ